MQCHILLLGCCQVFLWLPFGVSIHDCHLIQCTEGQQCFSSFIHLPHPMKSSQPIPSWFFAHLTLLPTLVFKSPTSSSKSCSFTLSNLVCKSLKNCSFYSTYALNVGAYTLTTVTYTGLLLLLSKDLPTP